MEIPGQFCVEINRTLHSFLKKPRKGEANWSLYVWTDRRFEQRTWRAMMLSSTRWF
jgi:hypothetical protein